MRHYFLIGLLVITLSIPALADAPIKILDCKGFDSALTLLGGQTEHLIEIYTDHARVDDVDLYILTTTAVSYTLDGPVKKLTVGAMLEAKRRIFINRVTGEYFISSHDQNARVDYSREGDPGCVERKQKF